MDERGIIIADRDAEYRKEMAEFFQKAGYRVETTDSAVHVLCSILQKEAPVLLLGTNFDKKLSTAELIHLLKKCNRRLHVIMVSEEMPLAQLRQVRQEGIFYHALKPSAPGDTGEIGTAVESAFKAARAVDNPQRVEDAELQDHSPAIEVMAQDSSGETAVCLTALPLLILGTLLLCLACAESAALGNSTATWLFLGFCTLIVITQIFPVFRLKLPFTKNPPETAEQQQGASLEE